MITRRLRTLVHYLGYLTVRTAICIVQILNLETCRLWARFLAYLCHDLFGVRRRVVEENLALAFPEKSPAARKQIARLMWRHLFLFVAEIAHLPRKIHRTNWRDYISLKNPEVIVDAMLQQRPIIIVSAHFGNFELAGYVLGILGFPTYTVARKLDNPFLDRFLNQFREKTGQYIIPKKGGFHLIEEVLAKNGAMCFLADQYAGSKGCWVDFFGSPASAHKAIALLGLSNNAPLVIGTARRGDKPLHYELDISGYLDPKCDVPEAAGVKPLTQWYTGKLEEVVRAAPEQYWWLHRRWKGRPPRSSSKKKAAA